MKRKLLTAALLLTAVLGGMNAQAQAPANSSFENWAKDTSILDFKPVLPNIDTFSFDDPLNWTSSNAVTGAKQLSSNIFVTQSTTEKFVGNSSIKLVTDTLTAPIIGALTLPGFAISGKFKISLTSFVGNTGFNPALVSGAGFPISSRKGSVAGFLKYAPVGNDSSAVLAILRKGSTLVAQAVYFRKGTDANFTRFSADFVYQSCLVPDTAVILVCSANPFALAGLANGGTSTLPLGSILYADSLFLEDTLVGFKIPPIAVDDAATTKPNTPVSISVLTNDSECYGSALTPSIAGVAATRGGAVVTGSTITYTPTGGYLGRDSFQYEITNAGGAKARAWVRVTIANPAGILDLQNGDVKIYPNPSNGLLNIKIENNEEVKQIKIYDVVGQLVKTEAVTSELSKVDVSNLNNGIYVVQLADVNGKVMMSSKFTMVK
jgi:hypothetical protein